MRRIILYVATSLDGYIANPDGKVDWLFYNVEYGTAKFMKSIDTIIMGRKTYEQALDFGLHYYVGKKIIVISRLKNLKGSKETEIICIDRISLIKNLKRMKGKDIWLMGGGELVSSIQNENLIDEYHFFVHPIILGNGIALFQNLKYRVELKLISYKKFKDGLVRLNYNRTNRD